MNELGAILEVLRKSAGNEADGLFDPSGTSGSPESSSNRDSSQEGYSLQGDVLSEDTTSIDVSLSLLPLSSLNSDTDSGVEVGGAEAQHTRESEELSVEEKISALMEMFPSMKAFDVNYLLKKAGNNYGRAVEELLNHAFFEDEEIKSGEPILIRGIDGFAGLTNSPKPKSRNQRRKESRLARSMPNNPQAGSRANSPPVRNWWDRANSEIDFIAQRTDLPKHTVSSTYHKSGASLATTIIALSASISSDAYLSSSSPETLEKSISDLACEFPTLEILQLRALITLTQPSTAHAHELAQLLATSPSTDSSKNIVPHYRPRAPSPTPHISPSVPRMLLPPHTAAQVEHARTVAVFQAEAARRKAKSNPLMGGAASHYNSVARDLSVSLERHNAAAAEALVMKQSRAGEVDLHGVCVKDAVRIARDQVEAWWGSERVGEWSRSGKIMGPGLQLVTGLGKHSEGGKSRIGPAVGSMLIREGWKVEIGNGLVTVVGRARK